MITWKIDSLAARLTSHEIEQRRPDSPIVVQVRWRVTAFEAGHSASVTGAQELIYDPSTDFTPYDQLTEAQVLAWVHGIMGIQRSAYEDMVLQQIEQQKAAPIVLPLPWQQPEPVIQGVVGGNETLLGGNGNDSLGGL